LFNKSYGRAALETNADEIGVGTKGFCDHFVFMASRPV